MRQACRSVRWRMGVLSLAFALLVASCGEGSDADSDPTTTPVSNSSLAIETTTTATAAEEPTTTEAETSAEISPCDIVGTSEVQDVFRGTVSPGAEFPGGICRYGIEGGPAEWVDVLYLGTAEEWDDLSDRYESNRGGIDAVDGVGEDAFHPGDHGDREVVFVANGHIYSLFGLGGSSEEQLAELGESVLALAMTIAEPDG